MADEQRNTEYRGGTQYLAAAMRFAGATILFLFGGLWLDRKLGTIPLFTIGGALLGAVLGFVSVYREFKSDPDHAELKRWSERRRGSGRD